MCGPLVTVETDGKEVKVSGLQKAAMKAAAAILRVDTLRKKEVTVERDGKEVKANGLQKAAILRVDNLRKQA